MPKHKPSLVQLLLMLSALLVAPAALAQEGEQSWPPAASKTRPAPVQLSELRSGGPFGLGLNIGSRTGLTLKLWPARAHGITLDVGATPFTNSVSLALGYTLHVPPLRGPVGISAQFYLGVGFRTRLLISVAPDPDEPEEDKVSVATVLGVRVPLGLSFLLQGFPVELFIEAAPAVDFWQAFGMDVEGIGGARVFF